MARASVRQASPERRASREQRPWVERRLGALSELQARQESVWRALREEPVQAFPPSACFRLPAVVGQAF